MRPLQGQCKPPAKPVVLICLFCLLEQIGITCDKGTVNVFRRFLSTSSGFLIECESTVRVRHFVLVIFFGEDE